MQQQHTCGRNFSFNTRQMKLTGFSFFQMIYHKNDHHFWPKLMVDSFSWRWESVGLSTHTQVQALAFNKNKSEKAFLWTKRSPRECNSNWPMLPFPPSLLSYTAAGYSMEKNFEFFFCPRGLYRQASSGHILNLFIRFEHFHHLFSLPNSFIQAHL